MDFFGLSGLSLAGRAEPLPDSSYRIQTPSSSIVPENEPVADSPLQRARVHTDAVSVTVIKSSAANAQASFRLKDYSWQTYFELLNNPVLSQLVKRTINSQQKTLYWLINEQRAQKYLNQCFDKLKQGFRDYLVKVQQERLSSTN